MLEFRFESFPETIVIGKHVDMSLNNNRTVELWQSFMPHRHLLQERLNEDFLSLQIVPYPIKFNPDASFTKWACCAVQPTSIAPPDMNSLTIPSGLYVVFLYKGSSSDAASAFGFIFGQWMPNSDYEIDNRPHFEVLGSKYQNNHPDSEEEIWVPIKKKK
jgi:AraC family transcriptional regulator